MPSCLQGSRPGPRAQGRGLGQPPLTQPPQPSPWVEAELWTGQGEQEKMGMLASTHDLLKTSILRMCFMTDGMC